MWVGLPLFPLGVAAGVSFDVGRTHRVRRPGERFGLRPYVIRRCGYGGPRIQYPVRPSARRSGTSSGVRTKRIRCSIPEFTFGSKCELQPCRPTRAPGLVESKTAWTCLRAQGDVRSLEGLELKCIGSILRL
jgi:hypothetical protein